ncbi:hypothetical protein Agub_g1668, partial [Astrephomene gubernaculifera]
LGTEVIPKLAFDSVCRARMLMRAAPPFGVAAAEAATAAAENWFAEASQWWYLVDEVVQHVVPRSSATDERLGLLAAALERQLLEGEVGGWEDYTALAGGFLPLLERLLRRAGEKPTGPEAAIVRRLLRGDKAGASLEPRIAILILRRPSRLSAALVATIGKFLRRMDPWVGSSHGAARMEARDWRCEAPGVVAVMWHLERLLATVVAPERLAAGGGGESIAEGAEAPPSQHDLLASYVLCEWLPLLSYCVLQAVRQVAAGGDGSQRSADSRELEATFIEPLLRWLPVIAFQCMGGSSSSSTLATSAAAAAEACSSAAAAAGSSAHGAAAAAAEHGADSDDGGWRQLLLAEVGAVRLLDAVLRLYSLDTE